MSNQEPKQFVHEGLTEAILNPLPENTPEYLRWSNLERRIAIVPELLPPDLIKYKEILKVLTPTSKGELTTASAGLIQRILTSRSPGELYDVVEGVQRYKTEAERALAALPELTFRWDYDMAGKLIRHNPAAQAVLTDYLLAVDWVNAGKWQPKIRNGEETKTLASAKCERRAELMTFSNEALGRLSSLVTDKQGYRQLMWQNQQTELANVLQADPAQASSGFAQYRIKTVQTKMNELSEAIENSHPADEELTETLGDKI